MPQRSRCSAHAVRTRPSGMAAHRDARTYTRTHALTHASCAPRCTCCRMRACSPRRRIAAAVAFCLSCVPRWRGTGRSVRTCAWRSPSSKTSDGRAPRLATCSARSRWRSQQQSRRCAWWRAAMQRTAMRRGAPQWRRLQGRVSPMGRGDARAQPQAQARGGSAALWPGSAHAAKRQSPAEAFSKAQATTTTTDARWPPRARTHTRGPRTSPRTNPPAGTVRRSVAVLLRCSHPKE